MNVIENASANEVIQLVSEAYEREMDKIPGIYHLETDDGTSLL